MYSIGMLMKRKVKRYRVEYMLGSPTRYHVIPNVFFVFGKDKKYIGDHVVSSGAPQHVFHSVSLHFSFHQHRKATNGLLSSSAQSFRVGTSLPLMSSLPMVVRSENGPPFDGDTA
jgi:hypothetical protein